MAFKNAAIRHNTNGGRVIHRFYSSQWLNEHQPIIYVHLYMYKHIFIVFILVQHEKSHCLSAYTHWYCLIRSGHLLAHHISCVLFSIFNLSIFQRANTQNRSNTHSLTLAYKHWDTHAHTYTHTLVQTVTHTNTRNTFSTIQKEKKNLKKGNNNKILTILLHYTRITNTQTNYDTSIWLNWVPSSYPTLLYHTVRIAERLLNFVLKIYLKLEKTEHTRNFLFVFFVFCECFFEPTILHCISINRNNITLVRTGCAIQQIVVKPFRIEK